MEPIAFRSCFAIEEEREQLRKARQDVIKKAKSDYEKAERKKEIAKQKGYDDWMLPSVLERIDKQSEHKTKSKKSKKEKKKKKKHKKEKKQHRDSESSDSESSDNEGKWVKKPAAVPATNPSSDAPLKRDNWMEMGFEALPTVSRYQIRQEQNKLKNAKKEEEKKKLESVQQERELNPFWKDGGTGLPEEDKKETAVPHISWLRKSYKRCQEQAEETGQSLEDVVAERWGSLRKLESLMKKAEKLEREKHGSQQYRCTESKKSHEFSSRNRERFGDRRNMFRSPESPNKYYSDTQSKSEDSYKHGSYDKNMDNSSQKYRSKSPSSYHHDKSQDSNIYQSSRSSYKTSMEHSSRDSGYCSKPSDSKRSQFMKPGEHEDSETSKSRGNVMPCNASGVPRWKKQNTSQPSINLKVVKKDEERSRGGSKPGRERKYSSGSSSSSSSSLSSASDGDDREKEKDMKNEEEVPVILTEDQMNDLSAKILRAELMGDDDLMVELQALLNAAKEARSRNQQAVKKCPGKTQAEDVLLTHVDRSGVAWPIMDSKDNVPVGKKKRKKLIETHTKEGQRQKYFHDDDKFDLKNLVQHEKMSIAENQNSMFARLAVRNVQKTTDEYVVDDMFIANAAREQSGAKTFDLQKARAISYHNQMSKSMAGCKFCFENISKHLLVAIGQKAYLALPDCTSLTEGHCILAPIQHVASSTAMDEDVWDEVQTFKKLLVRMFQGLNKDPIFLETSMHLNRFPHAHIECVPVDNEEGAMAPMYFKKAILECETEWNMNKKLVDLTKKDIRRSIPKGFPFFSVNFGIQSGFAHAIEDEKRFSVNFGKEIIGGMIDADPYLFRKGRYEKFEVQRQKVLKFSSWWKPYDFTSNRDYKDLP
ncbi:CWF19-like protein 2 [Octopus bimaculoides]|uniref:CWF19-like protein 2 n=1 Tax=Octopus bimaculoides TaxID=37653 RepID=A0A0L8I740_OCTBM|nr:CWF19-like protein 2 [Octopus bimaculoides]|eukprot:XP_014789355.1 PREDICTED: CWF19-like protein 2 [Octopus bimaculoides]